MKQRGFVLIFTLVIMSLVTILTQQLMQSTFVGSYFTSTAVGREKAKILALGGINLAMAQLAPPIKKQKLATTEEKAGDPKETAKRDLVKVLVPNLNKWQEFELSEDIDGVDGSIKFCITSEEGKININEAFDFQKAEFKKEIQILLQSLAIKGKLAKGVILKKLTEFFKSRKRKLDDISELIEIPEFQNLDVFIPPLRCREQNKNLNQMRLLHYKTFLPSGQKN